MGNSPPGLAMGGDLQRGAAPLEPLASAALASAAAAPLMPRWAQ
ncbi:hypothetical protein ACFP4H_02455 [Pseudophaeobacter arcticus]|nr:hypothetical protein [Pseudophaeobacter arcticus]